jgi:hypothetical protein
VQIASQSENSRSRANAGEFLDALLRRRDQRSLRELFLVVADNLAVPDRVARGSALLGTTPPTTREAAVATMIGDRDTTLAALASLHAAAVAGLSARVEIAAGLGQRAYVELSTLAALDVEEPHPHA